MNIEIFKKWLKDLSVKERHYLAKWVYFEKTDEENHFELSEHPELIKIFQKCTGKETEFKLHFHSMDYHYDWIYAALKFSKVPADNKISHNPNANTWHWPEGSNIFSINYLHEKLNNSTASEDPKSITKKRRLFTKYCTPNFTLQDADWLFLIQQGDIYYLIVLECKLVNNWEPLQLAGKLFRLQKMTEGYESKNFKCKMCLISPEKPYKDGDTNAKKSFENRIENGIISYLDYIKPEDENNKNQFSVEESILYDNDKKILWSKIELTKPKYQVSRSNDDEKDENGPSCGIYPRN